MRFAYADPPYIGCAKQHYGDHPDYAGEVDHAALIAQLVEYDAWALSCHSPSLRVLLNMCPPEARVGAWVKPFAVFRPNVNPAYAWEPVIFVPAKRDRKEPTVMDWVRANIIRRNPTVAQTKGSKPIEFSFWMFRLVGAKPGDEFHDLFPGSGGVTQAWGAYCRQLSPFC